MTRRSTLRDQTWVEVKEIRPAGRCPCHDQQRYSLSVVGSRFVDPQPCQLLHREIKWSIWDNLQVRILVIAPSILKSTLDLVDKINYPVDLIEVRRWIEGKNEFLHVNKLEAELNKRVKPTAGRPEYNERFYKSLFNPRSADQFLKYVREVELLIKKNGWELETNFKKLYCGFKAGFFNAFGIKWIGSKTFAFFFKLPEQEAKKFRVPMTRYEKEWKEAVYYIDPATTTTKDFAPLFQAAYKRLTGD